MKLQTKIAVALLSVSLITIAPSVSKAEDDNVFDGKSYPGALCNPQNSLFSSIRSGNSYVNTAGSAIGVLCPLVQDSWVSTAGLAFGSIFISNPGGTFSCTETAYDPAGSFVSSRSFSTTTVGTSQQLFFSSGTYLPTTAVFGNITITCTVPANGKIMSYHAQEKA